MKIRPKSQLFALQTPNRALIDAVLRNDLAAFIARAFKTLKPGRRYRHNWHIDAIVEYVMRVHGGELQRLIINQPPRSLKTICTSVAFVAWSIGHDPSKLFACVSYSNDLAVAFALMFRAVVTSEWYRRLFPNVRWSKVTETECLTTKGGGRYAVSVGGSLTGRGADIIIIDDPLKASDAHSDVARPAVNEWYATTLLTRLDDKKRGAIIVVAQRLHEDDLPGTLLREGGWEHLNLPAIAEQDELIPIGPGAFHSRKKNDVLHPEHEPLEILELQKRRMGSLRFSAQYQQRPIPAEGNLIKRAWIKNYEALPERGPGAYIVQSWDIASTTADTGDWSVCATWLMIMRTYYLLDVWRGRLEFPELKRKLVGLAREHGANRILIEQAGPGLQLIQELRASPTPGVPLPISINPGGSKLDRMARHCARFEAGQVHLPHEAPWLSAFLHEILAFPSSRYDDQIDSVSQFLNWAESDRGGWGDIPCPPIIIGPF